MKVLFCIFALSLVIAVQALGKYDVNALKLTQQPIIKNSTEGYRYNYNSAAYVRNGKVELIVRCQNVTNESDPYSVGPSNLSPSTVTFDAQGIPSATQPTKLAYIPNNVTEKCGTEDPRINYHKGLYYLFYTGYDCGTAWLSLSVSANPTDPASWLSYGPVFPNIPWSKSGAVLFADSTTAFNQHYLFWGDSSTMGGGIHIAVSNDTIFWQNTDQYLLQVRSDSFDSNLVEAGPPPLKLSSGDYLFIYNSARSGYKSVKPGWQLEYNLGFAILNGSNPVDVLQRSNFPIMSPEFDWETGNTSDYLVPHVVFLEGLVPDPNGCPSNFLDYFTGTQRDCFFGVYGGADSRLGAVRITVAWTESDEGQAIYGVFGY